VAGKPHLCSSRSASCRRRNWNVFDGPNTALPQQIYINASVFGGFDAAKDRAWGAGPGAHPDRLPVHAGRPRHHGHLHPPFGGGLTLGAEMDQCRDRHHKFGR